MLFRSNDVATATAEYPVFASITSGTPTNFYTSDPNYNYTPSLGQLTAKNVASSQGIFLNSTTITANYTIPSNYNGGTFGPVTVNSGVTVTIPSGSTWVVV